MTAMQIIFLTIWCALSLVLTIVFAARSAIVWNGEGGGQLALFAIFFAIFFVGSLLAAIHHITHR